MKLIQIYEYFSYIRINTMLHYVILRENITRLICPHWNHTSTYNMYFMQILIYNIVVTKFGIPIMEIQHVVYRIVARWLGSFIFISVKGFKRYHTAVKQSRCDNVIIKQHFIHESASARIIKYFTVIVTLFITIDVYVAKFAQEIYGPTSVRTTIK